LLDTAGGAVDATTPLLETTIQAPGSAPAPTTAPGSGAPSAPDEAGAAAQPTSMSALGAGTPAVFATPDRPRASAPRAAGSAVPGPSGAVAAIEPSPPWSPADVAPRADRATHTARAGSSRTPAPTGPWGPLGSLTSVSAAPGSGAMLVFFAALAAIFLLAAPGVGRRLRPALAPWPLPLSLASLERPG
jgi:hypothetical protein